MELLVAWYLVVRMLQHFLNEAQDETQVAITQKSGIKKKSLHICFKDYVLKKSLSPLSIF